MGSITLEELHAYHAMDREVFSRMVLVREPAESLLIMAVWLWLESKGYPNIVMKLVHYEDHFVMHALADETALCLECLESNTVPFLSDGELPLMAGVMDKNISLQMFHHNKFSAINGVKNFLNTVCSWIFTDILEIVLHKESSGSSSSSQPLAIPGFPHPVFGGVSIVPRPTVFNIPLGGLCGWDPSKPVSEDDRTILLTFSRGFPMTKEEVEDFFTKFNREPVFDIKMQEQVPGNGHPLSAKMILGSIGSVDKIMNGQNIAKFRINGKHIWARKYERIESQNMVRKLKNDLGVWVSDPADLGKLGLDYFTSIFSEDASR
ncbi:uncharacterized protein [Euphorbia lathyris]|uniref:uncharacterized protein n=1 Tax=Euphorbia lathyris TaxID=212925 RepID=UPI003313A5DC